MNLDDKSSKYSEDVSSKNSFLSKLLRPEKAKGFKIATELPKPQLFCYKYGKQDLLDMSDVEFGDKGVSKSDKIIQENHK